MGNEISRRDKSLEEQFKIKSNYILQQLDSFFGPIQGFKWENGTKDVSGLMDDVEDIDQYLETIKEERYVCNNLVAVYKTSLKSLTKDKEFRTLVERFVDDKFKDKEYFDINNFDVKIKATDLNLKKSPEDDICDLVTRYYYQKYLIYRLIKNIDPYNKEYNDVQDKIKTELNKFERSDIDPKMKQKAKDKIVKMETKRKEFQKLLNDSLNELLNDELSYSSLVKEYNKLISSSKLKDYASHLSSVCQDVNSYLKGDLEISTVDEKSFSATRLGQPKPELSNCKFGTEKRKSINEIYEELQENIKGLNEKVGNLPEKSKEKYQNELNIVKQNIEMIKRLPTRPEEKRLRYKQISSSLDKLEKEIIKPKKEKLKNNILEGISLP